MSVPAMASRLTTTSIALWSTVSPCSLATRHSWLPTNSVTAWTTLVTIWRFNRASGARSAMNNSVKRNSLRNRRRLPSPHTNDKSLSRPRCPTTYLAAKNSARDLCSTR